MSVRRYAVIVGGLAAAATALGGASAMASTSGPAGAAWGKGTPPPVVRHHHPRTVTFCFYSLETERDTLGGVQIDTSGNGNGGQGGQHAPAPVPTPSGPIVNGANGGAPTPTVTTPGPQGGQGGDHAQAQDIEVAQLVRVCGTITYTWGGHGHGKVTAVTATDVSGPFAWLFDPAQGAGQHAPGGLGGPGGKYAGLMAG